MRIACHTELNFKFFDSVRREKTVESDMTELNSHSWLIISKPQILCIVLDGCVDNARPVTNQVRSCTGGKSWRC